MYIYFKGILHIFLSFLLIIFWENVGFNFPIFGCRNSWIAEKMNSLDSESHFLGLSIVTNSRFLTAKRMFEEQLFVFTLVCLLAGSAWPWLAGSVGPAGGST